MEFQLGRLYVCIRWNSEIPHISKRAIEAYRVIHYPNDGSVKIARIKALRALAERKGKSLGLKEAKDWVDAHRW